MYNTHSLYVFRGFVSWNRIVRTGLTRVETNDGCELNQKIILRDQSPGNFVDCGDNRRDVVVRRERTLFTVSGSVGRVDNENF